MSSSRGAHGDYKPLGKYLTQIEFCRFVVRLLPIPRAAMVLEPHVGDGPWVQALLEVGHPADRIIAADIDPGAPGLGLAAAAGCRIFIGDFLTSTPPVPIDWVIGNPPYGITQAEVSCPICKGAGVLVRKGTECKRCKGSGRWVPEPVSVVAKHVERAIELVQPNRGSVFFLLRAAFWESRVEFWAEPRHNPRAVWAVWPRLAFNPEQPTKTDSCPYCTYWWDTSQRWDTGWRRIQWRHPSADEPQSDRDA